MEIVVSYIKIIRCNRFEIKIELHIRFQPTDGVKTIDLPLKWNPLTLFLETKKLSHEYTNFVSFRFDVNEKKEGSTA